MTVSTDAILFYGYIWNDEPETFDSSGLELFPEVTLGYHCSDEEPFPYLAIASTELVAARGYPQRWRMESSCELEWRWNQELKVVLNSLGLESPGEPGWYLASYWG